MGLGRLLLFSSLFTSVALGGVLLPKDVAVRQYGGGGGAYAGYSPGGTSSKPIPSPTPSSTTGNTTALASLKGDSKCASSMCISAVVNGTQVEYTLTPKRVVGWMAMGFGTTMIRSPIFLMWANADGSITLSQRRASAYSMPTVDTNPPNVATLSSNSVASASGQRFVFTVDLPGVSQQSIIYASGAADDKPSSSDVDARINQHLDNGRLTLNLAKSLNGGGTTNNDSSSSSAPFTPREQMIIAHAVFCVLGFLLFLPAGALLARWFRTFTGTWFKYHWIIQWLVAGTMIVIGVSLGIAAVAQGSNIHVNTTHKKWGIALLVLYVAQCSLGGIIHFVKPPGGWKARPPQNYLHAIFGIFIIGAALYQFRTGYSQEWPRVTGRQVPGAANVIWYIWVIALPILYAAGLALLPKQYRQEAANRRKQPSDDSMNQFNRP